MAKKLWCVATSHPLVRKIAEKYNLQKKQARVVLDNARKFDSTLVDDKITMEFLEQTDAFKKALEDFVQADMMEAGSVFKDTTAFREEEESFREELIREWNQNYSEEEVAEMVKHYETIADNIKISNVSTSKIASLIAAFPDTRRLEFLGNYVCKSVSECMTILNESAEMRNSLGIQTRNRRIDYFYDNDAFNAVCEAIRDTLEAKADECEQNGNPELARELRAAVDYFYTLLYMYGTRMFLNEGVSIDPEGQIKKDEPIVSEDDEDEDGIDIEEQPIDAFSASDQNKSIYSKIAPNIKILLSTLHDVNKDGTEILDQFGYGLPTYISVPLAVNRLLRICSGCQSYKEMIDRMQQAKESVPWIEKLLDILDTQKATSSIEGLTQSKSRKEQLHSMFFQSFRKQFTWMRTSFATMKNGFLTIVNRDVNMNHRSERLFNIVRSRFKRHAGSALFRNGMLDIHTLSKIHSSLSMRTKGSIPAIAYDAMVEAKNIAREGFFQETKQSFTPAYRKLAVAEKELKKVIKALGIDISDAVLNDYLVNGKFEAESWGMYAGYGDDVFVHRCKRLKELISIVSEIPKKLSYFINNEKVDIRLFNPFAVNYGEEFYDDSRAVVNAYDKVITRLTEYTPDTFEARTHINGKDYYPWNNPSTVGTIVESLTTKGSESIQDYIRKKYGKDSSWFLKPGSTINDPHFYSDWLEEIYHGTGSTILRYSEKPSFCGDEYDQQSDIAYNLSILSDFFSPIKRKTTTAWYRMLIASDKPRYSSIQFKRYGRKILDIDKDKDFKPVIADKAVDFFEQELNRSISVVSFAATGSGTKIDGYDLDLNDADVKKVIDKINEGKNVTFSDVVKNGRYIFRGTGAAFFLNKFILDEIENNTSLGKFVIDRIFNSQKYAGKKLLTPTAIKNFKEGFHNYMTRIRDEYFQYLDDIGLFEIKKIKFKQEEGGGSANHLYYLLGSMAAWEGMPISQYMQSLHAYDEQAKAMAEEDGYDLSQHPEDKTFYREAAAFKTLLEEFIYNNWLAKANMSQIFDVDLAFYSNTTNFQKRNAQVISSGYPCDVDAKIHGSDVFDADRMLRSITIKTEKTISDHSENIRVLLQKRMDQIDDPAQKEQFRLGMEYTLSHLDKGFDATDGQAFTSISALRKRQASIGEWSRSETEDLDNTGFYLDDAGNKHYIFTDEAVYQRMLRHETLVEDFLHVFAQVQKPFVYSFVNIERDGRTITVPVQHKNSEYALAFLSSFVESSEPHSVTEAIAKFMEKTARENPTRGIDTVNFDSGVKIGGNSEVIDLSGMTGQEAYEALEKAVYGENPAIDKDGRKVYRQGAVTEYDARDYKIVQQKPEHFKSNRQPLGSQFKILSINNINDTMECELPNGKKITGKELKRRYFDALKRKMKGMMQEFRKDFGLMFPSDSRIHKTSVELKRAMSSDQKFTVEARRALSLTTRNGEQQFVLPLDETGQQSAVEAMLYSKVRKIFYKQPTQGGIVVQATSWGASEDLAIRFYSSNPEDAKRGGVCPTLKEFTAEHKYGKKSKEKYQEYLKKYQTGYAYFEIEAPMPNHIRRMLTKNGKIDRKFFNADGTWNMEAIREVVPDSVFDAMCYRIPTEAKYSMMVCRIVRFSPEWAGSAAKYPKELTEFTGSDFDIDTDTVELRPEKGSRGENVDNEIFDLQLAALRSMGSVQETFKPGDFSDLSELSYYMTLLNLGYSSEVLDNMDFKKLKKTCMEEEDMDLMNPRTDSLLHNQNIDAKGMIGIAAVGVTSHAFLSLYNDVDLNNPSRDPNLHPENFTRIVLRSKKPGKPKTKVKIASGNERTRLFFRVVNDKNTKNPIEKLYAGDTFLDMMYDMDGKLISTEISKYVGASADAAKDAAEYRLNINRHTLPILVFMHRLGISSDVARLFIAQPAVKYIISSLYKNMEHFGSASMNRACDGALQYIMMKHGLNEKEMIQLINDVQMSDEALVLSYSGLKNNIAEQDKISAFEEVKIVQIFFGLHQLSQKLRNLDSFYRFNSSNAMRGSSFIERFVRRRKIDTLVKNLQKNEDKADILLPNDIQIADEFRGEALGKLCSMFPHIGLTVLGEQEMTERVILEYMHTYSAAFFDAVEKLIPEELTDDDAVKEIRNLYAGWKNYLMFCGDLSIADFSDEKTVRYYTRDFAMAFAQKMDELQAKNPEFYENVIKENTFLNSIGYTTSNSNYATFDFLSTEITGMSDTVLEQYKRDWEVLLNYPETRQLAIDIAIHFLARSAAFARDTPVNVMPLAVKEAIPNYINAYANADKLMLDEEGLEVFLIRYALNNSDNKRIVPSFEADKEHIAAYSEKDQQIKLSTSFYNLSTFLRESGDGWRFGCPVIKVNGQLYLLDDANLEKVSLDAKTEIFVIGAIPVSPLGIPNQMAEYTNLDLTKSLFEKPAGTRENENVDEETSTDIAFGAPIFESPAVETEGSDSFEDGSRAGTFLQDAPFGSEEMDATFDKLAKNQNDFEDNPFLESREWLRRFTKVSDLFGFKIRSSQRGFAGTKAKDVSYMMSVVQKDFGANQHENAKMLASLISSLGYRSSSPTVKTYTKELERANTLELSIPLTDVSDTAMLTKLAERTGIKFIINGDTKELVFSIPIGLSESDNDISARIKGVNNQISWIKSLFGRLQETGRTKAEKIEVNYAIEDTLTDKEIKQNLKQLTDESYEKELSDKVTEPVKRTTLADGEQIGISYLAELAIRRRNGEKIDDDLHLVFDEWGRPLKRPDVSYESSMLRDAVVASIDEDAPTIIRHLLSESREKEKSSTNLDNAIINVANWIKGGRSQEDMLQALDANGIDNESGEAFIDTIKQKLKELDIC